MPRGQARLHSRPWATRCEVATHGQNEVKLVSLSLHVRLKKPSQLGVDELFPLSPRPQVLSAPSEALPLCCHSSGTRRHREHSDPRAFIDTNLRSSCRWASILTTHCCPLPGCGFRPFSLPPTRILGSWRPYAPETSAPWGGRWVGGGFPGLAFIPTRVKQGIRSVRCCWDWSFRLCGLLGASGHHLPLHTMGKFKSKKREKQWILVPFRLAKG